MQWNNMNLLTKLLYKLMKVWGSEVCNLTTSKILLLIFFILVLFLAGIFCKQVAQKITKSQLKSVFLKISNYLFKQYDREKIIRYSVRQQVKFFLPNSTQKNGSYYLKFMSKGFPVVIFFFFFFFSNSNSVFWC